MTSEIFVYCEANGADILQYKFILIFFFCMLQVTVRQFKDHIKEKTNIEPELQRLIFCGRAMNDEHPLSNYGERICV